MKNLFKKSLIGLLGATLSLGICVTSVSAETCSHSWKYTDGNYHTVRGSHKVDCSYYVPAFDEDGNYIGRRKVEVYETCHTTRTDHSFKKYCTKCGENRSNSNVRGTTHHSHSKCN